MRQGIFQLAAASIMLVAQPVIAAPCLPEKQGVEQFIPNEIPFDGYSVKVESQYIPSSDKTSPNYYRYCFENLHEYGDAFFEWAVGENEYFRGSAGPGRVPPPLEKSSFRPRSDPKTKGLQLGLSQAYGETYSIETVQRSANLDRFEIIFAQASSQFDGYSVPEILASSELRNGFIAEQRELGAVKLLPLYSAASISLPLDAEAADAILSGQQGSTDAAYVDLTFFVRSELVFENGSVSYAIGAFSPSENREQLGELDGILSEIKVDTAESPLGGSLSQGGIESVTTQAAVTTTDPIIVEGGGPVNLISVQVNATYRGNVFLSFPAEMMLAAGS